MDQTWISLLNICLAAGLSLLIGLEREFYSKQAGVRTYTLVGMGAALFTVVSKYGFFDVISPQSTGFDGSRVAAQIVSGIGFIGAGLIFVRRDAVRGLTTAAGIWFVAAVGMAAGAGMHVVSCLVSVLYLVVMLGLRPLTRAMPHARSTIRHFTIHYLDGHGILRDIMETIGKLGLSALDLRVTGQKTMDGHAVQEIVLTVSGEGGTLDGLSDELSNINGVEAVISTDSP